MLNMANITLQLIGDKHYQNGDLDKAIAAWQKAAEHAEENGLAQVAKDLRERVQRLTK